MRPDSCSSHISFEYEKNTCLTTNFDLSLSFSFGFSGPRMQPLNNDHSEGNKKLHQEQTVLSTRCETIAAGDNNSVDANALDENIPEQTTVTTHNPH